MSSLISRSIVLGTATLLNQAVLLLSPMLLVRLLPMAEYGRYRQFVVVGSFLMALASFSITSNINYFVARTPRQAAAIISNTCIMLMATASLAALAIVAAHSLIMPAEIESHWLTLLGYVFLHVNLDVFTPYALARGRSDQVLLYGVGLMMLRVGTIVGTALVFGKIEQIFIAMVLVELLRNIGMFLWLRGQQLLNWRIDREVFREQLRFILPFGSGAILFNLNENLGRLLVSFVLGPSKLAIFTVASYQVPILTVVKSSLSDVIFPDMVQRSTANPSLGLELWKRTQVLLFIFVCPSWLLLTYFAEPLIKVLFTATYVGATPYFQVLLLMMVRQCFDFSTPLRSLGNTAPSLIANTIALACNGAVAVLFLSTIGLWAPTLGFVVSQCAVVVYLAYCLKRAYGLRLRELLHWQRLAKILAATFAALAVLHGIQSAMADSLTTILLGVAAFGVVFLTLVKLLRIDEFEYLLRAVNTQLRQRGLWLSR